MNIQIEKLILILIRITSFIALSPGFSFRGLPNTIKIAISFSLSIITYMVMPDIELATSLLSFFLLAIKESLLGLGLGYISQLVYGIIEMAGQLIDFQVGFSMASVYDPVLGKNASNYGRLYYWLAIGVFFLLDLHHRLIEAIIKSFEHIPLGHVGFQGLTAFNIIRLFSRVFELALNLAAPIIIVVLVTDVVLGIISRTVPQINVLMLGMPVKSMISFIVTMLILSWLINSIGNNLGLMPGYLERFIPLFTG